MGKRTGKRKAYHHGDLPRVLLAKAAELLNERGVSGFSLREVARRAKVAAAAPSHHFGNVAGLLTAIANDGFRELIADAERVLSQDLKPEAGVICVCEAYVKCHSRNPGVFSIMFRNDLLNSEDSELNDVRPRSLELLKESVRRAISPDATEERVKLVATTLWSTMHGMVTLRKNDESLEQRITFAVRSILAGAEVDV